ncbi:hypothetical protein [Flaviaesturariibacter amylovorans]|uniref:DUF4476 domain-containing protein n=1 Tax=Flaviaesturariibacter amylovorans TaxID=1084520 RepID=A0ABP8HJ62_9BACT
MNHPQVQKFLFVVIVVFLGCKSQDDSDLEGIGEEVPVMSASTRKIDRLNPIIQEIGQWPYVEDAEIGYAGDSSAQFKRYLELRKYATPDELEELADHANTNVRVYAFAALVDRDTAKAKNMFLHHLNDKAMLQFWQGSTVQSVYVNIFMFRHLKDVLTPAETKAFGKELAQHFTVSEWEELAPQGAKYY